MTTYREILTKLYSLNGSIGVKYGLENVRKLHQLIGFPASRFPSIHIAGTNGKGSVSAKIAKGLESRFGRVGLFTSPHISSFRERISINREIISEDDLLRILVPIMRLAEQEKIPATFFELTTLLALKYFAEKGAGAVVLETGLGGRLDATNIVTPLLSVITSIGFDHTEILGSTLEKIAQEKGGIIKPGVPVVLGPTAKIVPVGKANRVIQLPGTYDDVEIENREIARAALEIFEIPEKEIRTALTTRLPCRRQKIYFCDQEVILDVAHNPIGLERLFCELKVPKDNLRVICGLSKTKDLKACLDIVQKSAAAIHLVSSEDGRTADPETLKGILLSLEVEPSRIVIGRSVASSLKDALSAAAAKNQQVMACGTFYIMGEARQALGITEPRD